MRIFLFLRFFVCAFFSVRGEVSINPLHLLSPDGKFFALAGSPVPRGAVTNSRGTSARVPCQVLVHAFRSDPKEPKRKPRGKNGARKGICIFFE
jgi:hypothetical protein